jgi:phage major head subunit gpT-like protein
MISRLFESDQESETYNWLGQVPQMREWVGRRQAKGFFENTYSIANKKFEATLEVLLEDLRRDKTTQTMIRVGELAARAAAHWASLMSTLILNGETTVCYDGQYFFDTDHKEGNNTTNQSNDLSIDISALPAAVHGSTTLPSAEEMSQVILQCVQAIIGFKDNENEPMNENAQNFLVMTPISLMTPALSAVTSDSFGNGATNLIPNAGVNIQVAGNARLTWTEQIAVFRTDGDVKPIIAQEEVPIRMQAVAEGSELEFEEDMWRFGVMASREVGYGYWQHACMATMT